MKWYILDGWRQYEISEAADPWPEHRLLFVDTFRAMMFLRRFQVTQREDQMTLSRHP